MSPRKTEIAKCKERFITHRTKLARFSVFKDLAGFDFASSKINDATIRQLHQCAVSVADVTVVWIGGTPFLRHWVKHKAKRIGQKPQVHRDWRSGNRILQAQALLYMLLERKNASVCHKTMVFFCKSFGQA